MGIFGSIAKVVTAPAKAVSSAVSVVAKPIGKAIKPATNLIRDAAVKATANTPLGGAVANIAKLDFAKNPLQAVSKATVENFKGAAELGKGLVAAKVGGAVSGAVGSTLAKTPLAGMGIDKAIGGAAQNAASGILGANTPAKASGRGGTAWLKDVTQSTAKASSPLALTSSKVFGSAPAREAGRAAWGDWSGRRETLGGVLDDG